MTFLATHISTDGTCNGKFVGNEKVSDSIEHHPIYKCQYTKKLAFVWQLHANASDLFVEAAIDKLGAKADEFILKKEKESNLFKGGSGNDVVLTELLSSFRDKAFKYMSHGMMDICYSENQYRKNMSGLETAEAEGLVAETKKLVTYYLYTFIRYTQFMANTVWKDVAGENIDFKSNIPKWSDLNAAKKTELETLEKNILETVGPSFKVIEANLKKESDKELFVQYYRRMLDTYIYIYYVLNNASSKNTFQKLSLNIQELKADAHLLMKLLEGQKWVSGEEEKEMKLVRVVIDQLGHTLESAFMWKHLFKRAHDDTEIFKRIIDDFSMCLLINYRYKYVSYIVKMHNTYKELIWDDQKYDKGTDYEFDSSFFKNVAYAYPNFVLDALNKKTNDEDLEWVHRQKLAMKLDIFKVYGRMLYGPYTNLVVTHAYNKMDVSKEYEGVHNRYRNILMWKMKHQGKNIKNKLFACKGCGGPWALQKIWKQPVFYRQVDMVKVNGGTKPDNKHFMVTHRILGSSSLVTKYVLVLDYKFNVVNKAVDIISDIKVPSKFNKKQFKTISDKLLKLANNPYSNKDLIFNSIDKEMFVRYKKYEDFIASGENKGTKIETAAGSKVFLFQETGKVDKVCIEALINASDSDDLIIVDKHKYQYLVVGIKTLSIPAEDCETIGISSTIALNESSLYYPILVNREQEFQKLSIAWAYQSPQLSEGIEDEANLEGISYIDFFDTKDADAAVAYDATESNKMINSSIGKRDITVYDKVRDNVKCVFKNSKERTMETYIKGLMPNVIDLALPEFNLEEKKEGVDCADISKLLKFDSAKEFIKSAIELKKSATDSPLTSFAVCTTYRKTVKMQSKMTVLHIINWKGEFKEKKVHSSPQVHGEYFLHLRVNQSFQFKDFLKTKMVPAHWLKIEPIPMGEKKEKLYITILVRLTSTTHYIGLTTENNNHFNKKPEFEFPGFDKAKDKINTHLMQQIYDKGLLIEEFKKSFTEFVSDKAKDIDKHREFIKVRYGHNATEGCDKGVRGISIHINDKYEIEETCGTFLFGMQNVYYIELMYLSAKTAAKVQGPKFPPPSAEELDVAGVNGYVMVDAGMKNDEMDVKIGFVKKRIWVRPNITLPYELHTEKK